jgi:hypothetical protein
MRVFGQKWLKNGMDIAWSILLTYRASATHSTPASHENHAR